MFNYLKNFKEKYKNSSSWKELLLSLAGLENVFERLNQAETDKERIEILKEALELQQAKITELAERVNELEEENQKLKKNAYDAELMENVLKEFEKLENSINQIEVYKK